MFWNDSYILFNSNIKWQPEKSFVKRLTDEEQKPLGILCLKHYISNLVLRIFPNQRL